MYIRIKLHSFKHFPEVRFFQRIFFKRTVNTEEKRAWYSDLWSLIMVELYIMKLTVFGLINVNI